MTSVLTLNGRVCACQIGRRQSHQPRPRPFHLLESQKAIVLLCVCVYIYI